MSIRTVCMVVIVVEEAPSTEYGETKNLQSIGCDETRDQASIVQLMFANAQSQRQ